MYFHHRMQKNKPRKKFTAEEDARLIKLVEEYGEFNWERISAIHGTRNARQCHDRWKFYINPRINKAPFTPEEDWRLINLVMKYGGMWVQISKHFKNRSDVQMKNRWKILQKQMNLVMPNFEFLQNTSKVSSPYSPCFSECEQPFVTQNDFAITVPKDPTNATSNATINATMNDTINDYDQFDNIFGISFSTFQSELMFLE